MKEHKRRQIPKGGAVTAVCTGAMALLGAGMLAMYFFSGYGPLLMGALMQLLPVAVQLALWLPAADPVKPEGTPNEAEDKKEKRRLKRQHARYRRQKFYKKIRTGLMAVLMGLGILVLHVLFWRVKDLAAQAMNYLYPTLLAVGFVVCIVLEKWCAYAAASATKHYAARLNSLVSALRMAQPVYLLILATTVVQLLGLYDARSILRVLLAILFVYETVVLAFCIAVRLIRKELDRAPELPMGLRGAGSDMNILAYLEENTGITMRSLWSLQLIKQLLPVCLLSIALVIWLSTCVVQVDTYQQGALFRLGKLQGETLKSGLHLTLPWPFDRVEVYDTDSVSKLAIGYVGGGATDNIWTEAHGGEEYRLLLGGGEEIVSINLVVEYRISDLNAYIKSSASPESLLQARAYEIVTERTISTDLDTLLAADREAFSETFRKELTEQLATYSTGIEVINVVLESIHPPVEIAEVYQNIISAGIDAEYERLCAQNQATQLVLTAQAEAVDKVGFAKSEQLRLVSEATGTVTEFMAAAAADEAYRSDYRFQRYINALAEAYSGAKLIIAGTGVDTKNIYIGSVTNEAVLNETVAFEGYQDEEKYEYLDPID